MNRPVSPRRHDNLTHRIVAIGLAWVIATGTLPDSALSSLAAEGPRTRASRMFAGALPVADPLTEEPAAPAPAEPETEKVKKAEKKSEAEADKWGEITVAQPKIWQYERVNSLLDALLRDVEGVSLADLTGLDPNATNGAAVKFVQSMLEIGVKYDQAAATTNAIALQNYRVNQGVANEQIQANNAYLQELYQQRQAITTQLLAETQLNFALQTQVATSTATGDALTALKNQQTAANNAMTGLQQQLTLVNNQISAANAGPQFPPPPNIAATSVPTAAESPTTFSSFLSSLPDDLKKNVVSQLQSPSFPATKRLDNFITLLYEHLAREISVLQDDLTRDLDNVPFLVQFDVGLYPANRAKNHVGVVEFIMNCDGCKVYSIYPGQSSYNLANFEGASKRYSLWGAFQTLFGFGISGAYRRQTDTLRGDLVQSVYMSGFQEGAPNSDRSGSKPTQRFGWYYGASPFETVVTPGVRSTFAIISIPSRSIKACMVPKSSEVKPSQAQTSESKPQEAKAPEAKPFTSCLNGIMRQDDGFGTRVALDVTAHSDWVRRDDPYYQKPHWWRPEGYAGRSSNPALTRSLRVVLPGTDGVTNVSDIVLRERDRLHVTGLEYNTVYLPRPPAPTSGKTETATNATPPSPGTTQASATGTGAGSTTVTVTGPGTVTATSSGSGGSTANATAASSPAAKAGGGNESAQTDSFTGCAQYQCAAVLMKLAEPIDPNLVVAVRGEPLRRVRDWRGRATSILPPAQSASDMPPAAVGAAASTSTTQPQRSENPPSRSLLEADKLAPNTWMEVDSHRLLLSISRDLAGDTEFPSIQLVDPGKRALFVPLNLDEGFTEIVMNGFHLPTRKTDQLQKYVTDHFLILRNASITPTPTPTPTQPPAAIPTIYPAGPYAYETFLPLFLPQREAQKIDAYLGETGVQLLIGFLDDSPDVLEVLPNNHKWLASRVQVILEDSDLDLAWSLSCYAQNPNLVCDVPWKEIQNAYRIVKDLCDPETNAGADCPSITKAWSDYPAISSLQVWVEQYDPENKDSFYTPTPARLGRFPVAAATRGPGIDRPDVGFSPWHFEYASGEFVKLAGCRYLNFPPIGTALRILGQHIPQEYRNQSLEESDPEPDCVSFAIPTVALTHPEVVIEYRPNQTSNSAGRIDRRDRDADRTRFPHTAVSDPCFSLPASALCTPESLLAARFQPYFGRPVIIPHPKSGPTLAIDSCLVEIPTGRVDCNDSLDVPDFKAKFGPKWKIGPTHVYDVRGPADSRVECPKPPQRSPGTPPLPTDPPDWQQDSRTGQIRLTFEVTRQNLPVFLEKRRIHVIRGTDQIEVATLPEIRPLLLPTKLTVVNVGKNQFELLGPGAELIEKVTMQGPGGISDPLTAGAGAGVALISLPQKSNAEGNSGAANKPTISVVSPESGKVGSVVKITGKNFGSAKGTVTFGGVSVENSCWNDTAIVVNVPKDAKTGKVALKIGGATFTSKKDFKVDPGAATNVIVPECVAAAAAAPKQQPVSKAQPAASVLDPGTYTVLPLVSWQKDDKGNELFYLPLEATDLQGKPLTYIIAEQKSDSASPPKGVEGPTTTLTITKKETKTPAPTSDSGPTKQ